MLKHKSAFILARCSNQVMEVQLEHSCCLALQGFLPMGYIEGAYAKYSGII